MLETYYHADTVDFARTRDEWLEMADSPRAELHGRALLARADAYAAQGDFSTRHFTLQLLYNFQPRPPSPATRSLWGAGISEYIHAKFAGGLFSIF